MTGFVGANPDQLEALGHSLEDSAGRFEQLRGLLSNSIYDGAWGGPDADSARSAWDGLYNPALAAASQMLVSIGALARSNALAQREASLGEQFFLLGGGDPVGWPPPDYPGDGDPEALQQYWLTVAAANAGIDMSLWDTTVGAWDQKMIVEAVYTYYAKLYLDHPYLQWAGMAAMVGPSFAAGFYDLDMFQRIAQILVGEFGSVPVIGGLLQQVANSSQGDLRFFETTFLQMQQDIFFDQAVMHEAYLNGGMPAIVDLYDAGIINQPTLDAWQQIDTGVANGDSALIAAGNTELLYREQHDIIQPAYDALFSHGDTGPAFTYFLGLVGDPAVPGGLSYADYSPLFVTSEILTDIDLPFIEFPTPDIFVKTPFPDGNLANFDDRWEYISQDTLPAYQAVLRDNPALAEQILSTPVDERITQYRVGTRYEAIMADIQQDWSGGITIETHEENGFERRPGGGLEDVDLGR